MKRNTVIGTLAALAILGALSSMFFSGPKNYNTSLKPSETLGEVVAQEISTLLGGQGKIVVIEWNLEPGQLPRSSEQMEGFKRALKKEKGISIAHIHSVSAVGPVMSVLGAGFPGSELLKLAQQHPQAGVIVSFVGAPVFSREQLSMAKDIRPRLIVVDVPSIEKVPRSSKINLKELINTGIVDLAVVSTAGDMAELKGVATPKGNNFDPYFKIVSTESLKE